MNNAFRSNMVAAAALAAASDIDPSTMKGPLRQFRGFAHQTPWYKIKRRMKRFAVRGRAGSKGEGKARIAAKKRNK